jgi:8-oxo-dGTP pyrophosphatase MutT (NUDIX family)
MNAPKIRLIALCVCRREDKILVMEGYDSVRDQSHFRPLGGGIEFGELGAEAVARELMEEIGAGVIDVRYLCTLENIFVYEGKPCHEIVMIYDGSFTDESLYGKVLIEGAEANGEPIRSVWKSLNDFRDGHPPLYPSGLLQKLVEDYQKNSL